MTEAELEIPGAYELLQKETEKAYKSKWYGTVM